MYFFSIWERTMRVYVRVTCPYVGYMDGEKFGIGVKIAMLNVIRTDAEGSHVFLWLTFPLSHLSQQ